MLAFLRKVLAFIEAFTPDFKEFMVTNVLETCQIKLKEDNSLEELELLQDESHDILIVELAETISRFSTIIDNSFDENLVIELMNSKYYL